MVLQQIRRTSAVAVMVAGFGAVLAGCSPTTRPELTARYSDGSAAPMTLSCEPNQRAVMHQVVVNGVPQTQLECSSAFAAPGAAPVAYAPSAPSVVPVSYGYSQAPIPQAQLVRTTYTEPVVTRQVAPQRVAYQPARERSVVRQPKRSVKKSAVIIGSSAGVGAAIGAVAGGKKGAGIGALVGGGGAALWDQLTRRQ